MKMIMTRMTLLALLLVAPIAVVGCGGGSSGGETSSGGDNGGENGGDSGGTTPTPTPSANAVTVSCETKSGHSNYNYTDCSKAGCHGSHHPLSYGGTATSGSKVTVIEKDGTTYNLIANSQNNFCLRSSRGGNPSGTYTAILGGTMIAWQTNGSCNASGCHDSARPIY